MKGLRGFFRRAGIIVSLAFLACTTASPAFARSAGRIHIENGTLAAAIHTIASATGAEIVTVEPGAANYPVRARKLNPDPRLALDELLRSTEFRAISLGSNSFRIERRPAEARPRKVTALIIQAPISSPSDEPIVVEGKFPTPLQNYPGSVSRSEFSSKVVGTLHISDDVSDLARTTPVVSATAFGEGRNKLFVRGVADSSFNGTAQPTTSIYLGETLIGFGSPNPNPKLYDIASIEILEGPQGTLFGSGSMGGVIRIMPNPVNLQDLQGFALAGVSTTVGGSAGWKLSGMLNLPVIEGNLGLRMVAYSERDGGYIDDPRLGSNINGATIAGGRLAVSADLGGGISLNLGGFYQSTRAQDMQYADRTGPLQRSSAITQPYSSDLKVAHLDLRKDWDSGITLTSVWSIGHRTMLDRFDASIGRTRLTAYDLQRSSSLLTSETRVGGDLGPAVSWVLGVDFEHIKDGQSRALGIPADPNALDEVTNRTTSGSLFVQGRARLSRQVQLTIGMRYTVAETDSQPARGGSISYVKGPLGHRFDPTVAVLWQGAPRLAFYGRFQTGYRNGGVSVARGVGKVADFSPDSIVMGEAGFRLSPRNRRGLSLSGAVSVARWKNVLAELLSPRGIPVTSNIGDANIWTVEASGSWTNGYGLSVGASLMLTSNHLVGDLAAQSPPRNRLLPDTPKFSATAHGGYTWGNERTTLFTVQASGQYVGRSILGPGAFLDLNQGDYVKFDLGFSIRRGPVSISMNIENALNSQASRFALGNPLMIYRRDGRVPLQPRTIGITAMVVW